MAENPFKIIGRELPKFLQEMGVPFLGKDKPRGSVMDPDPNAEKAVLENAFIAAASVLPVSKVAGMLLKNPVATGAGAVALTGDPLAAIPGKAGLAMMEGSGNAEAAFRSGQNSSLARSMVEDLKKALTPQKLGAVERFAEPSVYMDLPLQALVSKISTKELSKYGTPEFLMDRYLPSTRTGGTFLKPPGIEKATEESIKNPTKAKDVQTLRTDIEDLVKAQSEGKTLYQLEDSYNALFDVSRGVRNMISQARELGISDEAISSKSLQSLNADLLKGEDRALKELQKSMEAKKEVIADRTMQLSKESEDLPSGFVKLKTDKDLAQETDALNHCVGAVGLDNNRWIPGYDTVTGKASKLSAEGSSLEEYMGKIKEGGEVYSYRPEGAPQFTVMVKNGRVEEAYAANNKPLNEEQNKILQELVDKQGFVDDFSAREAQFADVVEDF